MSILLRTISVIIEVSILAAIAFSLLQGLRLTIFDLGINARYSKAVTLAVIFVGAVVLLFFIAHLTAWYPTF